MKRTNKITVLILLLVMALSIGACKKEADPEVGQPNTQQPGTASTTESTTVESTTSESTTIESTTTENITTESTSAENTTTENEGSVKIINGTVGDYTIGYDPENFAYSSEYGSDTFTYTKWDGERNVYYSVYVNDMDADALVDGLLLQNSDRYDNCSSSSFTLGEYEYEVMAVYCDREIDAPDYDLHFFLIESSEGCYIIETQFHSSMYGEFYVDIRNLIDTIHIKNALTASEGSSEDNCPEPLAMVGKWERTKVMVEGEEIDSEPGICTLSIKGDSEDSLIITYTDKEFPDNNYKNKPMNIDSREMYYNCGNDCWVADVDYVGRFDTTFAITLTEDNILILQNYFLLDGAPSVSYEFFERAD